MQVSRIKDSHSSRSRVNHGSYNFTFPPIAADNDGAYVGGRRELFVIGPVVP
jgi:hypothetical protein